MSLYPEYKMLNLPAIDKEMLAWWEEHGIFQKSIDQRPEDKRWVFYEGPPSANGMPGIHHVMSRAIKDLFCRYHTLKGYRVERKGGWDTHGLPVELSVEKELGITKEDIGKTISIEDYNAKCKTTVMRYKAEWDEVTRKMGYWLDLDHPYITYEKEYIESVWYLLKQLYDQQLLYKGFTIQPYSPAAGTGLSSHELNMPGAYKEVKDTTVVALFKVKKDQASDFLFEETNEDVRIAAWTTTPWTLPSNTALSAGPNINYVKIKTVNPYTSTPVSVVMASELVGNWFGGKNQPAIESQSESFKGKQLAGIRYEPLLDFGNPIEPLLGGTDAYVVLTGDHVTTADGTGIVHTAPSFGAEDQRVAKANGVGTLTLVDITGKFKSTVGPFSNRYIKDYKDEPGYAAPDIDIAIMLKTEGKALNVQKYEHNYPHCWRTDKPVMYYPLDSWFVKSTARRERMIELNKTINWKPAHTGEKRFGNWLENLQDWNLSRSRFWGIPLPIWRTDDGLLEKCIGSIDELRQEIEKANKALNLSQVTPADLHRPFIDEVVLVSADGRAMRRETDLIDVWFDSGSMPYAQWHYPFENQDVFKRNFPADFIAEGVDQTRGWFFTLHAIAVMVFDSVAFKNVVSNGLVLDKNGQKMSKRLGNAADPFVIINQYGADAARWYMLSNAQPWDNLKFDEDGIVESTRKLFSTLYNTYSFFALYANLDNWKADDRELMPVADRPEIDRWILSRLHSLLDEFHQDMDDFDVTAACRKIEIFVSDHLSNWYVRLNRRRFWKGELSADKRAAYATLHECLLAVSQMISPVAPFFSDWLYQNLTSFSKSYSESVHLSDLPKATHELLDDALMRRMDYAQHISSLILSIRKKEKLRVRLPLRRILLPVLNDTFQEDIELVKDLILSEVNVKEIEFITNTEGIVSKKAKANFKTLGKRLGKNMKEAADIIQSLDQQAIAEFEKNGSISIILNSNIDPTLDPNINPTLKGGEIKLEADDLEIVSEDIPGWQVASEDGITVALDVSLDENLISEGTARELVNRIQNLRKNSGLNVTDRIKIKIEALEGVEAAVSSYGGYIQNETLANSIHVEPIVDGTVVEWMDGEEISILVEKA
ncbi:MAG TPA: isoleucine--tRNA ligase [Saprospiraceae bacterium]|nr:isoleucine--tRNA ligase [Saprospiraceae bacterium]